ncbi:hypothetical protein AB0M43_24070 [Longispora sp. NPDC051575]|uniref:hypothetical protein n=1 Tax=Longispora sp. NPDC051575 TaxID=3154943 RepID=UPI00343BDD12
MRKTFVHLETTIPGLHHWPGAHGTEIYLSRPHRHLFGVELDVQVDHGDREIEIIAEARWLLELMGTFALSNSDGLLDFGPQSCEHLAGRITDAAAERFGDQRELRCRVLEDGVLGAFTEQTPAPRAVR